MMKLWGCEIIFAVMNTALLWVLMPWEDGLSRLMILFCLACMSLVGLAMVAAAEMALEAMGFEIPDKKEG